MKVTNYALRFPNAPKRLKIAVAADLHNNSFEKIIPILKRETPDMILIPGDLMDDIQLRIPSSIGYEFLRQCVSIAPTYYSLGNHEIGCYHRGNPWRKPIPNPLDDACVERIRQTGAIFLDNEAITADKITICGLTSGINGEDNFPDPATLARFAKTEGFRILLCHHPEYFREHIAPTDIELTVSGHAHGGHWRVFGRGIYSPGQGLFPKDTSGVIDGRCVISRGLGNHTWIPRIFNPTEVVMLTVDPSNC